MNLYEKANYIIKAMSKSNPKTAITTVKNLYFSYGWVGLKNAVINKAQGRSILPEFVAPKDENSVYVSPNARDAYCKQILEQQQAALSVEEMATQCEEFAYKPLISIVMPMYNAPIQWLKIAIASLQKQCYKEWELCIVDDASSDNRCVSIVEAFSQNDQRIRLLKSEKNQGISTASNLSLKMAKGDFIALMDQDDVIPKDAFFWFVKEMNECRDVEFLYSDECKITGDVDGKLFEFLFKPDWSPCLMINNMFVGHLVMYKTELLRKMGGFNRDFDFAQDYELAIRIGNKATCIRHIPRVLYFWRALPTSTAAGGKEYSNKVNMAVVHHYFNEIKFKNIVYKKMHYNYAKLCNVEFSVSVVVPSDSFEHAKQFIDSFNERTSYKNYEIILVVNASIAEKVNQEFIYMDHLRVCVYDDAFNLADKLNKGAKQAMGEVLVFVHDDICPVNADWMQRMMDVLAMPGVGAVSPVILNACDAIEYAGAATAISSRFGLSGPLLYGQKFYDNFFHYLLSPWVMREFSILSDICIAVKRETFDQIGGFDSKNTPNFKYNNAFSFSLQERGYRCVYNPHGILRHQKSNRLKEIKSNKEVLFCLKNWSKFYASDQYLKSTMKMQLYGVSELEFNVFINENINYKQYHEKKNILVFSHELSRTGAPVVLLDAVKEMMRNGYYVVVASPFDGPLRQEFVEAGAVVIVDKMLLWGRCREISVSYFEDEWYMDSFIREFDLVFASTVMVHNLINRYMNDAIQKKIIWWLHEGEYTLQFMQKYLPEKLNSNITVLCGGGYVQEKLTEFGVKYVLETLLYGVKDVVSSSKPSVAHDKVRFLLAGTIDKRKGQDILVRAIQSLPIEYQKKAEFIFIGMLHEQEIYKMVEGLLNRFQNVKLMDSITREALFALYQDIDCVISPSRDDPMPVVMTEAMMFSKICICSNHTGTSYYLQDGYNGFVFKNEDFKALAKKIMHVIDNKDNLESIKSNSRKVYEEFFSMDIFSQNFSAILQEKIAAGDTK